MDEVKNWAFALCCAAVGGALLSLLLPDSSVGRVCRFSVQIFLLCSMILPISQLSGLSLSLPKVQLETTDRAHSISSTINLQIRRETEKALENHVGMLLTENDLSYQKIEAIVNTAEDGSISIDCIRITLQPDLREDSSDQYSIALEAIRETTGVKAELAAENGGMIYGS